MTTPHQRANGHRRRQLEARVYAEDTHCAICGGWVDKALGYLANQHGPRCQGNCAGCVPHPMRPEVDEDIPRSRGGSPYERANCNLTHRACNQRKGNLTLAEYRAKLARDTTGAEAAPQQPANLVAW